MSFLEHYNAITDSLFGIIFTIVGGGSIFYRKELAESLLDSNKAFWSKSSLLYNEKASSYMTNLMIPIIGIVFFCIGLSLLFRVFYVSLNK